MVLVLSGITFFAVMALASIYNLTLEPIAKAKIAKRQNAVREVLPAFDHVAAPVEVKDGPEISKIFKAYDKNNNFVGAAVEASSNNGFNGKIVVMVGFDKDANITNYSVLQQNETPGLGSRMVSWFKDAQKKGQSVLGLNAASANLTVSKDGGDVDAITAATISSKAFLFAVRNAYQAYSTATSSNTTK
ncbi:MAG TPA: RnfABCDGE type electron transport complex subunit G [Paludibacter sp.]|nr:RnfABCDGE type electron transport complex subunit G [Paludibacter sp.]